METVKNNLTPSGYVPRIIEKRLDTLLSAFGCVEISGPKWCGKTWTAMTRSESMIKLDDPSERLAVEMDPSVALLGDTPHLVDEWQEVPEVRDAVRRYIDDSGNKRGLFLLTGSSMLKTTKREKVRHSGTGRIAKVTMRPMTLSELGYSTAEISLKSLLDGEPLVSARCKTSLADVARWCCRGGWPANLGYEDDIAIETAHQYIQSVLDVNIIEEGRSSVTALALLRALALNTSQAVTYKTLSCDMGQGEKNPDVDTIAAYLELLTRLHIIEGLKGWEPPMRAKARVRIKPKQYFCDPSLSAALLGANIEKLLHDAQTLGLLFENLVIRDLRVFVSSYSGIGNSVFYYRDSAGLEVDAILECGDKWAGIEIKLSDTKADDAAKHLLALRKKMLANPNSRNAEPMFLAVIVGCGSAAYQRPDGVMVIPAALLGA